MANDVTKPSGTEPSYNDLWSGIRSNNVDLNSRVTIIEALGLSSVKNEVENARGGKTTLDSRISTSLDDNGELNFNSLRQALILDSDDTPSFITSTSFSVPNDRTGFYKEGVTLRLTLTSGTVFATVVTSSFSSVTTVSISGGDIDNTLTVVELVLASMDFEDVTLRAIDKIVATDANIVDVFLYDTSKDPDGGTWIDRVQHTSHYREELGTATRGQKRRPPSLWLLVANADTVTIYDVLDLDANGVPEMAYVFDRNGTSSTTANHLWGDQAITSVTMFNGEMIVSYVASWGISQVNFIKDATMSRDNSREYHLHGGISERNDGNGYRNGPTSGALVSDAVNDVSITVLPGAPIDVATGLPTSTILVGTEGGASTILASGTVADYTGIVQVDAVAFDSLGNGWIAGGSGTKFWIRLNRNFDGADLDYQSANIPAIFISNDTANDVVTDKGDIIAAGPLGLAFVTVDDIRANSMVANVTSDYNTGWMPGDIRGAWLSDITAETIGGELVGNGGFDSDTIWVKGTGWTIAAGVATKAPGTGSDLEQTITITDTVSYTVTFTISGYVAGTVTPKIGGTSGTARSANGTFTETIAAGASGFIELTADSTFDADIDVVSVLPVVQDRSVKANHLQINGTALVKSVVTTNAELMAFSGFTATDNLTHISDADWDVITTGALTATIWFKSAANSAIESYMGFANAGNTLRFLMTMAADGKINCIDDGATAAVTLTSVLPYDDGIWHKADFVRTSSTARALYIDDVLVASNTTDAGSLTSSGNLPFACGVDPDGSTTPATTSSLALMRLEAYDPTTGQVTIMYADERPLFQEGALATLQGSSDGVNKAAFDPDTDILLASTSDGTTRFSRLEAIDDIDASDTPTSADHDAVSGVQGMYAIGTAAEAVILVPVDGVRDALSRPVDAPDVPELILPGVTTDATASVVVGAIPVYEGETLTIEATVDAAEDRDVTGEAASYRLVGKFYHDVAGNVTIVGAVQDAITPIETTAGMAASLVANTTDQTVEVQVTGVAASTINWTTVAKLTSNVERYAR